MAGKKLVKKQQNIFPPIPNVTRNISNEILSKELKSTALEFNQFENRHTNNINWTFLHVQLINIPT